MTTTYSLFSDEPVEFAKPLQKVTVTEGQPATLSCELAKVSVDLPITWLKEGKEIPVDNKHAVMRTEGKVLSLHIDSTVLDDEAEYAIVVGKTKSKAELLVDGKNSVSEHSYQPFISKKLFQVLLLQRNQ